MHLRGENRSPSTHNHERLLHSLRRSHRGRHTPSPLPCGNRYRHRIPRPRRNFGEDLPRLKGPLPNSGIYGGSNYHKSRAASIRNPVGEFLDASEASPVYRLLSVKGLGTTKLPPMGTLLASGNLAFRQRHHGHTPGPNWPYFLDFASRFLHAPAAKRP